VRGAGETFNLIVPIRRIREWAKEQGCEFLLDPAGKFDAAKVKIEHMERVESPASGVSLSGAHLRFAPLLWRD
jgi:hypothetical protein